MSKQDKWLWGTVAVWVGMLCVWSFLFGRYS